MKKTKLLAIAGLAAALGAGALNAQAPGFKRVELQDRDLSAPGRHAVQARAEFDPGGAIGRHTHPGEELSVVLSGTLLLEVDGQPSRTIKAGSRSSSRRAWSTRERTSARVRPSCLPRTSSKKASPSPRW